MIKELANDIAEKGDFVLWAYWILMDNKQEIYVDYYYLDDPDLEKRPVSQKLAKYVEDVPAEYKTVADFDKKMSVNYPEFFRKMMMASDLLQLFKQENETI
ncbi:hypothetical protein PT287_06870 [Lactobacillus sp. ESL0679]|uniref:hypothetical protein n=1 Tax=Lactobacillus sp. ESL0679 TaxID=2983209 RepID=UPI0023F90A65|nr:hypothetical protein [Lactobacillus sp. ESL0679]MDF7683247.1 hypothetical protein [Lactobacillus sp. ESL0679]